MKGVWFNNLVNRDLHPDAQFRGHTLGIEAICFLPDSRQLVSGSHDTHLKLWDVERGACVRTATPLTLGVWSLDHDQQNRVVCTGSDGSVALVDFRAAEDTVARRLHLVDKGLCVVAGERRDSFILGSNSQLMMLDAGLNTLAAHETDGEAFFSAQEVEGKIYACTSRGNICVFDASLHKQAEISLSSNEIRALRLAQGRAYCAAGTGVLGAYELQDERFVQKKQFRTHGDRLNCMDLSDSREILVTGSKDGTALVWKLGQMEFTKTLIGPKDQVSGVRVSPDSRLIAVSTWDPNIFLYKTEHLTEL